MLPDVSPGVNHIQQSNVHDGPLEENRGDRPPGRDISPGVKELLLDANAYAATLSDSLTGSGKSTG